MVFGNMKKKREKVELSRQGWQFQVLKAKIIAGKNSKASLSVEPIRRE